MVKIKQASTQAKPKRGATLAKFLLAFPRMLVIQEICARIALETGNGLAETFRKSYFPSLLYLCVGLLLIANTINLGADLGAMTAALLISLSMG